MRIPGSADTLQPAMSAIARTSSLKINNLAESVLAHACGQGCPRSQGNAFAIRSKKSLPAEAFAFQEVIISEIPVGMILAHGDTSDDTRVAVMIDDLDVVLVAGNTMQCERFA